MILNSLKRVVLILLSAFTVFQVNAQTDVIFTLTTDCYATETSWGIFDATNNELIGAAAATLTNDSTYNDTISLPDGCYELRVLDTYGDGLAGTQFTCAQDGSYGLKDEFENALAVMVNADFDNQATHPFCLPFAGILGCTDATACNYNAVAVVDDGSCESTSCAGCTDATACNYDATATIDDGSCESTSCAGCTNDLATNYDATATIDDGSCTFPPLNSVITTATANFCPGVIAEMDGTGSEGNIVSYTWDVTGPETFNATGSTASFTLSQLGIYTVTLTVADASATDVSTYDVNVVDGTPLLITIEPDAYPQEISYTLTDDNGVVIDELLVNTLPAGTYTKLVCLGSGCHSFSMVDSYGDGLLNGGYYSLTLDGVEVINSSTYGTGETTPLNCAPGTSCFDALDAALGTNTATYDNSWFKFTPAETGQYNVTTCGLATCNTVIWIYDYCQGLPWNDSNEATIYYNDDDCGTQSNVNPLFQAGLDYYIRIGDSADDCTGDVDFEISYIGPVAGCLNTDACNFDPIASVSNGTCYFNDDPECSDLGPDLYVLQDVLQTSTFLTTLPNIQPDDCYIQEGCIAGTGDRDIVRFTTHIKNIGTQDYYVGPESANSDQFEFDPCHGHFHYEGYAEYILYDNSGVEYPEIGFKNGFCVLDLECSDGGVAKYGCNNMGITAGCGDIYSSDLACQWVDITTVPIGTYTLVVRTNWDQSPDNNGRYELRYDNNWAQVCFTFDRDVDGNVIDFVVEPVGSCTVPTDCLGQPFGDAQPDCNGDCPGLVVKGDANLSLEIEAEDAQEYVNDILGNDTQVTPCSDMDSDNDITVSDAAVLSRCAIYGTNFIDAQGVHNHCEWISEVTNQNQTTTLSIGDINTTDGYVDVYVLNPDNRIVGYEFEVSGIEIMSAENLYTTDYTMTPATSLGGTKVVGLSYNDESVAKNLTPAPLVRLYYTNLTGTDVCVSSITDIVNVEYHNTLTAIGSCISVSQGDFAEFSADNTTVCEGETVSFTDESTGVITSWNWNFSGGMPASSVDQNPTVTYAAPGIYDVTLTVGDGGAFDAETKVGYITVTAGNTYYLDMDDDGYGDSNVTIVDCSATPPAGYSANDLDCDDTTDTRNPDATEICNGIDDNCDGQTDEGLSFTTYYADTDGDGYGDDAFTLDACDGAPAGFVSQGGDCDDTNGEMYPGGPGTHKGDDNDCNGSVEGDEVYVCIGDLNGDTVVNINDLTALLGQYGCLSGCTSDLDFDGAVTTSDITVFLAVFGSSCE